MKRIPKNYNGKLPTGRTVKRLLPKVLKGISAKVVQRPDLVLETWNSVVGTKIAPMAQPIRFEEGILFVHVTNSTLLSILEVQEKKRLLILLRKKLPAVTIKTIVFER